MLLRDPCFRVTLLCGHVVSRLNASSYLTYRHVRSVLSVLL